MTDEEEKPIRVVDRRMFTPEGDLREGVLEEDETETARERLEAPPRQPEQPAPAEGEPASAGEELRGDFVSLVQWLATTAYAALGLLPKSGGRRDPATARQMIDWLAALEQKTRGNITFQESELLSQVLYELRLAYVEVTRPPAK